MSNFCPKQVSSEKRPAGLQNNNIMSKYETLIDSDKLVLVDFFAEWCGPCKTMKPILEDVKKKIGSCAEVIAVDVDKEEKLSAKYKIQSVPTLILFHKGEVLWRKSGVTTSEMLVETVTKFSKEKTAKATV